MWYCYYAVKVHGPNFLVCGSNPNVTIQIKAIEQYFHAVFLVKYFTKCNLLSTLNLSNNKSERINRSSP